MVLEKTIMQKIIDICAPIFEKVVAQYNFSSGAMLFTFTAKPWCCI